MDPNTARWAQIVWMERDELGELHRLERSWATRSGPSREPWFKQKGMGWEKVEKIAESTSRTFPDGYWPKGMDERQKADSIDNFRRQIYPLWKGIEEKDRETDEKMTQAEIAAQDVMSECLTLHKQDMAIYSNGIKPHRFSADQEKMANLRRRASRAVGA